MKLIIGGAIVLFFVWGFIWQAVDRETFPDDELPKWFVRLFR